MRGKVEAGALSPINTSKWATLSVPVLKNNTVRICGDYKLTVKKALSPDVYPLPTPNDLFSIFSGGVTFTKLDLSHVCNHLLLDEEAKQYLAINTHRGLFCL